MARKPDYAEIVRQDRPGSKAKWYWRVKSGNNKIIATCGERYDSEYYTMKMVKRLFPTMKIVVP